VIGIEVLWMKKSAGGGANCPPTRTKLSTMKMWLNGHLVFIIQETVNMDGRHRKVQGMFLFGQWSMTMLAEEHVVQFAHAGCVKVTFAVGMHGRGISSVEFQATLITVFRVAELAVASFATAFWCYVVVDASSFSWSVRT